MVEGRKKGSYYWGLFLSFIFRVVRGLVSKKGKVTDWTLSYMWLRILGRVWVNQNDLGLLYFRNFEGKEWKRRNEKLEKTRNY